MAYGAAMTLVLLDAVTRRSSCNALQARLCSRAGQLNAAGSCVWLACRLVCAISMPYFLVTWQDANHPAGAHTGRAHSCRSCPKAGSDRLDRWWRCLLPESPSAKLLLSPDSPWVGISNRPSSACQPGHDVSLSGTAAGTKHAELQAVLSACRRRQAWCTCLYSCTEVWRCLNEGRTGGGVWAQHMQGRCNWLKADAALQHASVAQELAGLITGIPADRFEAA